MLIILCLYIVALWPVFSKFKLVRWGWLSGTISLLIGGFILATFLALFNYLTPSGRVTVTGRVVEVTPNVTGQIVTIPVKPNVPVKSKRRAVSDRPGAISIQGRAVAGIARRRKAERRNIESELRSGDGECYGPHRAGRIQYKAQRGHSEACSGRCQHGIPGAGPPESIRDVLAQLNVAKAAQQSAKLALDSEIGGVNTTVAQIQAQLDDADWELSQTTIRAPADGYVTVVALTVGDRALQVRSVMSFIVEKEITLVGMFSQNGFQTIKEGAAVDIVFDNVPGRIYHARIIAIPKGIGQGQVAVSGTLARTNALGGATVFPAEISIPDGMNRDQLRLGMSGSATAFAGNAGVIGLLASILVWVGSYTAYL